MRVLGLIPARGGSKGVPRKNIKLLGGKPLIQYTVEAAQQSKLLTQTILSSEDDEIIEITRNLGLEVPFKRPSNLSEDKSPTLPVIQHALSFYAGQNIFFDAVCLLQTTAPFRAPELIDQCIEKFIASNADSLISVLEVPHEFNPCWTFNEKDDGFLQLAVGDKMITRRQDLPKAYYRDGSIYLTKTEVLMEQNSLYGNTISYFLNENKQHVNIDTIDDWKKAESIVNS